MYEVHNIADAECSKVQGDVLFSSVDLKEARSAANELSYSPYGTAIVDAQTGEIDWGFGFKVEVPEPESKDA